jgi:hypothetical protein
MMYGNPPLFICSQNIETAVPEFVNPELVLFNPSPPFPRPNPKIHMMHFNLSSTVVSAAKNLSTHSWYCVHLLILFPVPNQSKNQ